MWFIAVFGIFLHGYPTVGLVEYPQYVFFDQLCLPLSEGDAGMHIQPQVPAASSRTLVWHFLEVNNHTYGFTMFHNVVHAELVF